MLKKIILLLLMLGLLSSASGCAINRATARAMPGADLSAVKTYYVVQKQDDTRGIDKLIENNLLKRGFTATSGPEMPQQSYKSDAVVTYVDRWSWDITMFMVELTLTVRNPTSNFPLAVGYSVHTSLTRKSPDEMVDEVLTNILNNSQKKL